MISRWHAIYTFLKKTIMSWFSFAARGILTVVLVCGLLYWADMAIPMGALLVFLLVISIAMTWAIVSLLKDDDVLADLFED